MIYESFIINPHYVLRVLTLYYLFRCINSYVIQYNECIQRASEVVGRTKRAVRKGLAAAALYDDNKQPV
jgi:hypothetical protein